MSANPFEVYARRVPTIETPASHAGDPATSHAAERQITVSGKRGRNQQDVLALVRKHRGRTSAELARHAADAGMTHLDRAEIARRLPELATAKLIRRGATVKCSACGNNSVTWWEVS